MPRRSPARYLAPLALVAFLIALLVVVTPGGQSTGGDVSSDTPAADTTAEPASSPEAEEEAEPQEPSGPRFYDVQPGDTPSTIAERTGVPLERLESLNPDIDPQQLTPGQRLRLRR